MNLKHKKRGKNKRVETTKPSKISTALFTTAKTVSNRNPLSRGQGLSGESKVAILQLLQEDQDLR